MRKRETRKRENEKRENEKRENEKRENEKRENEKTRNEKTRNEKTRNEKLSRYIGAVPVKIIASPDVTAAVTVAARLACLCSLVFAYLADDTLCF